MRKTGEPRETPSTSGVVRNDPQRQEPGSGPRRKSNPAVLCVEASALSLAAPRPLLPFGRMRGTRHDVIVKHFEPPQLPPTTAVQHIQGNQTGEKHTSPTGDEFHVDVNRAYTNVQSRMRTKLRGVGNIQASTNTIGKELLGFHYRETIIKRTRKILENFQECHRLILSTTSSISFSCQIPHQLIVLSIKRRPSIFQDGAFRDSFPKLWIHEVLMAPVEEISYCTDSHTHAARILFLWLLGRGSERGMGFKRRPTAAARALLLASSLIGRVQSDGFPSQLEAPGMLNVFAHLLVPHRLSRTIRRTATMQWYADNNVRRLDWPALSPDLNPIQHIWEELDRRVRARQARPKSIAQLMEWLQEEWRRIPVDVLHTLVESMPDSVAAVIAARVSLTRLVSCDKRPMTEVSSGLGISAGTRYRLSDLCSLPHRASNACRPIPPTKFPANSENTSRNRASKSYTTYSGQPIPARCLMPEAAGWKFGLAANCWPTVPGLRRLDVDTMPGLQPHDAMFVCWLYYSPPTSGEPGSIPDFRRWESCGTMPLVVGFSRESPGFPRSPSLQRCSVPTSLHRHRLSRPPKLRASQISSRTLSQLYFQRPAARTKPLEVFPGYVIRDIDCRREIILDPRDGPGLGIKVKVGSRTKETTLISAIPCAKPAEVGESEAGGMGGLSYAGLRIGRSAERISLTSAVKGTSSRLALYSFASKSYSACAMSSDTPELMVATTVPATSSGGVPAVPSTSSAVTPTKYSMGPSDFTAEVPRIPLSTLRASLAPAPTSPSESVDRLLQTDSTIAPSLLRSRAP
ncbi:hypothetical protein PR048_007707 [Dryococelus australis]|uniref:Tc1-like transposase DDE domain-containing protein n=1 Tax=Dryococelus australis TaxID=614101 RepID=A0ABQ9HVY0_9NEOP|nr:hypothetical protein PR048_007707 [Dryococelus australis]